MQKAPWRGPWRSASGGAQVAQLAGPTGLILGGLALGGGGAEQGESKSGEHG